jgi:hypothetical protein
VGEGHPSVLHRERERERQFNREGETGGSVRGLFQTTKKYCYFTEKTFSFTATTWGIVTGGMNEPSWG